MFAGADRPLGGAEDPDLGLPESAAHAARVRQPLVAAQRGQAEVLGHTVGGDEPLRAEELEPGVHERRRHHRGPLQDEHDAGQVALAHVRPGRDARQHRGRGREVGDPVELDHIQNQRGIELFEDH